MQMGLGPCSSIPRSEVGVVAPEAMEDASSVVTLDDSGMLQSNGKQRVERNDVR